jgi:NTE family protein
MDTVRRRIDAAYDASRAFLADRGVGAETTSPVVERARESKRGDDSPRVDEET